MTTAVITRPAAKPSTARTLTSLSSCSTAGLSCASVTRVLSMRCRWPLDRALDDLPERFVELRIVDRHNRAPAQLMDERRKPQRAERERKHHIQPADAD